MRRLRSEARASGGDVVSLLGNHEFMNAMNDWRYVTPEDIASFHGELPRRKAMSTAGWIGSEWNANYSVNARVPYHSKFPPLDPTTPLAHGAQFPLTTNRHSRFFNQTALHFIHGGISRQWALEKYPPDADIVNNVNILGKKLLKACTDSVASLRSFRLPPNSPKEFYDFYSADGPVWYRGYSAPVNIGDVCEEARQVANRLRVRRLVMGHTPQDQITSLCNGTVILIDTGISRAYNGVPSAAEFIYTLSPLPVAKPMLSSNQDAIPKQWLELEQVRKITIDNPEPVLLDSKERITTFTL